MKKFGEFINESGVRKYDYKGVPINLGGVQLYYNQRDSRFWLYKEDKVEFTNEEVRAIKKAMSNLEGNISHYSFVPHYTKDLDINKHDIELPENLKMPNFVAVYVEDDMIDRMILGYIEMEANSDYTDL